MKLIKCYNPPVNEIHLADYILIPEEKVYKHTRELYMKARENPNELEDFIKNFPPKKKEKKEKTDNGNL